jgi:hypothetical protein
MMLAVLASPAVTTVFGQDSDAYYMVITYGDGTYEVGNSVTATVHVFNAGADFDADSVNLSVGDFPMRDITLTKGATGKWSGSFVIEETDMSPISSLGDVVPLMAVAYINDTEVEDAFGYVPVDSGAAETENLLVSTSISPPGIQMDPGQTKTVTWKFYNGGDLVDPNVISLWLDDGNLRKVDPIKDATGIYSYDYTMAEGPKSKEVDLDIEAEYIAGPDTLEASSEVSLYLTYFHVWAMKVAASATTASFELYVSNVTGGAVETASINVDYSYYDDNDDYVQKSTNGTTDINGKADITLAYNDLGENEYEVDVEGKVTAKGKEQTLDIDLQVKAEPTDDEPDDPDPDGMDVILGKDIIEFDKNVNLPGTLYYDADGMGTQPVHWYVSTPNAVINKGTTTTNVDGAFSVDFRTPSKGTSDIVMVLGQFETPIEDISTLYHSDTEGIALTSLAISGGPPDNLAQGLKMFRDNAIDVDVAKLAKGKDIPVTVTWSGATEQWTCMIIMGNERNVNNMDVLPTWTYWSQTEMSGSYGDVGTYDNGKFKASIFIPENLPNKDFFVAAVLINNNELDFLSMNFDDWIKVNYIDHMEVGKAGSTDGDGDATIMDTLLDNGFLGVPFLYWIVIFIVLILVAFFAGAALRKRGATKAMEKGAVEPTAEAPAFEGELGPAQMPMPEPAYDQMQAVPAQAEYGAAAPPQPEAMPPMAPETEYAAPPPPQPEYTAPAAAPAQPEYGAPAPAPAPAEPPQPEYAAPAPAVPDPAAPPVAPPAPEAPAPAPGPAVPDPYAVPVAPPPTPEPAAPPEAPPQLAPEPAAPPVAPPAAAPAPEAPPATPPAAAPAPAPAAEAGATMTIRCQKCHTTMTIPRKRPIKVTCPNCGVSGVLR